MREIEDLPEDLAEIAKAVQRRVIDNSKTMQSLAQQGAEVNVFAARFQHFVNFMVESGMMTEEQYWSWALNWEESLAEQLVNAQRQVNAQIAHIEAEQRKAMLAAGAGRKPGGIIVPGR